MGSWVGLVAGVDDAQCMLVGVLTGVLGSFSREGFVRSVRWPLSIGLCRGQRQGFSVGHGAGWKCGRLPTFG